MNKPIIKAKENCALCEGKGLATSFFGGIAVTCNCITNQIDIRNSHNKRSRLVPGKEEGIDEYVEY